MKPERSLAKSRLFATILIVGGCVAFLGAYYLFAVTHRPIQIEISGPIELGPQWLEIRPQESLKIRRRSQYIALYLSDEHSWYHALDDKSGTTWAMLFPDGSKVRPEVTLVDRYGKEFPLDEVGFLTKSPTSGEQGGGMSFSRSFDVSIDSEFAKAEYPLLRIRSEKSIHVSRILWICYNPK